MTSFGYTNLSDRGPGPFVTVAGWLLPGVRSVQRQVPGFAAAWRERNTAALAATGPLWVALGDSMTLGIGASTPDRGWVGQLATRLATAEPGWRVVNLGVTGARVRDVLGHQLPVLEQLGVRPDLVTLLIGNNDMLRRGWRRDLPPAVRELHEHLPRGLSRGTVVGNQPGEFPGARELNRLIDDHRDGLVLAELRDPRVRDWRGRLAADHFHPNDLGYTGIATVFGEAVGVAAG